MPTEPSSNVKFEIGHVLFIDVVGYSKLLITDQSERLQRLKEIVWEPSSSGWLKPKANYCGYRPEMVGLWCFATIRKRRCSVRWRSGES
jgi:hypothetical protein